MEKRPGRPLEIVEQEGRLTSESANAIAAQEQSGGAYTLPAALQARSRPILMAPSVAVSVVLGAGLASGRRSVLGNKSLRVGRQIHLTAVPDSGARSWLALL